MTNQEMINKAIDSSYQARDKSVKLIAFSKTKEGKEKAALINLAAFVFEQSEIIDELCLMLTKLNDYIKPIENAAEANKQRIAKLEKEIRILKTD